MSFRQPQEARQKAARIAALKNMGYSNQEAEAMYPQITSFEKNGATYTFKIGDQVVQTKNQQWFKGWFGGSSISKWSNPKTVYKKAAAYGLRAIRLSTRKHKKYMALTPKGQWVHFGAMGMEDFTKHRDLKRRRNYLTRSAGIQGAWKKNKYSANNLARHLLW